MEMSRKQQHKNQPADDNLEEVEKKKVQEKSCKNRKNCF